MALYLRRCWICRDGRHLADGSSLRPWPGRQSWRPSGCSAGSAHRPFTFCPGRRRLGRQAGRAEIWQLPAQDRTPSHRSHGIRDLPRRGSERTLTMAKPSTDEA